MKRIVSAITMLAIAGALVFAGGGADKSGPKKLTIGFSQLGAESSWRTAETDSIKATAAERGIDLKFSDAQQKQENQIKAIRSFIAQKVDGIILAPVVETGWESVLTEAKAAKIPVVLVDRGIKVSDDSLYATVISSDFIFEGQEAAKVMAKLIGGKGNVVELQGTPGASAAVERKKGFEQALAAYPEMKVIKSQTGDFNRAGGKQVMEAFLKSDGDKIAAVYAHNDDMALGAIQAIEEYGKKPGVDIKIVSIDGVKGAFEAMVEGKLNATVECNPLLGPLAFDSIARAIAGETLPKWIKQVDNTYTSDVAKDVIGSRKY
jgi:simple sugar transport system substrate-binding protein